jgi:phosphoribosylglycinamide formyltransferase-1
MTTAKLPIAVLISGSGSTLQNLIEYVQSGKLDIEIRLVIASRADAGGIQHAIKADIPYQVLRRKDFPSPDAFRDANFEAIRQSKCELVVMGGYLQLLLIPPDFANRVINIHPALIPSFCGKGYYGEAVHQAAIEYGVKISGCTVHFVDNQFDHGPIIAQETCIVEPNDTPELLQQRVGLLERNLLPRVVQAIAEHRVYVDDTSRTVYWQKN